MDAKSKDNWNNEQPDFKGVNRTNNKTLQSFLKHIRSEYHLSKLCKVEFENQYEV